MLFVVVELCVRVFFFWLVVSIPNDLSVMLCKCIEIRCEYRKLKFPITWHIWLVVTYIFFWRRIVIPLLAIHSCSLFWSCVDPSDEWFSSLSLSLSRCSPFVSFILLVNILEPQTRLQFFSCFTRICGPLNTYFPIEFYVRNRELGINFRLDLSCDFTSISCSVSFASWIYDISHFSNRHWIFSLDK